MNGIRRALLPVLLVASALTCAFALQRALACPIQAPPQPLRTLYKLSERVVVARVGAKEVLATENNMASFRVTLHVTENVKGAPVQVLHFYHDEYVGKEEERQEVISFSSGRPVPQLKRGERYLFFLDPREEGGYEVNDEEYAVKELSDEELKVYLERMKELAEITRQEPENKHALVEWLVRCAEEPATRWEGAYELLESAQAAERDDEAETKEPDEAEAEPAQTGTEASDASDAASSPEANQEEEAPIDKLPVLPGFRYTPPDPTLMLTLNAVQKQRLADAFFATPEPVEGDDQLLQLVKEFGDARFPSFILARLHRFEEEAPMEAELWVGALAASLKNEQVKQLTDSYIQDTTYYEEDESEATAAVKNAANSEVASSEEAEPATVDEEAEVARALAGAERATRKRSAMLKALLARLDLFVATSQLASAEKQ